MLFEHFEELLVEIANWANVCFELVGIVVLIIAGIKGIIDYINHNPNMRLILAEGMATSLEFKLGSEIIRTVVVREINELYFIAGLIILRASLTLLIHWEIKQEAKKEVKVNPSLDNTDNSGDGLKMEIKEILPKREDNQ